ncbi:MAG: metal-dependent hydrolase [Flavobacteriales bacterium]|nr:metal-dependent hydrolase [Flavobacteriales bacterium]
MNITYYGHSCFGIKTDQANLLFDPFISPNKLAEKVDINTIEADFILVSHGHEDHVADLIEIGKRTNAKVISNFEIATWAAGKGLADGHPMNHGGNWKFDFGNVKYVNAVHSSVLPDGTYGGNPGGFVVKADGLSFYYAGDTALTYDMKLLGDYDKIDFAFLPIGDNFTMDINDALIAADFIKCDKIIGMHYDTFGFIEIDKAKAKSLFAEKGKELILIEINESITI